MGKKVIKKKTTSKKNRNKIDIKDLSIADLYALYLFVSGDGNNKGFGLTSPGARAVVRSKQKEIEKELYMRSYGFDPFEEHKVSIEGIRPEDIDLDKVAVIITDEKKEPLDEKPQTFVVAKNMGKK